MRTRSLAICSPFGWRMFSEMPRLPAFLLLNWPPMSGSLHAGQRPGRRIARGAAADRRHRRQPRVGIVLPLDLEALRAHRREKPRAAGRGEKPGEVEDLDRPAAGTACRAAPTAAGSRRRAARPARSGARAASPSTAVGVLAEQRRAAADLPARLVAEPFAGRVAEAAAELRDARPRRRSCASASARRARSRAACAAAPRAGRHPAPRATACPA